MYSSPTRGGFSRITHHHSHAPGMPPPSGQAVQGITSALRHGAAVSNPGQGPGGV